MNKKGLDSFSSRQALPYKRMCVPSLITKHFKLDDKGMDIDCQKVSSKDAGTPFVELFSGPLRNRLDNHSIESISLMDRRLIRENTSFFDIFPGKYDKSGFSLCDWLMLMERLEVNEEKLDL